MTLWAIAGVASMLLDTLLPSDDHTLATRATSSLIILFGAWAFWKHGEQRITAAGVYCLSIGVFVGFPGWWWTVRETPPSGLHTAVLVSWWTTYAMYFLFWNTCHHSKGSTVRVSNDKESITSWGIVTGILASAVGTVVGIAGLGNPVQPALGGMALISISLILRHKRQNSLVYPLFISLVLVIIFWNYIFSGGGRLNLVSLALASIVLVAARLPTMLIKRMILLGTAPAVYILGQLENLYTTGSAAKIGGLGSVVNPLMWFARMVSAQSDGQFALGHGKTFVTTAVFWVPRSLWPDKPAGFGTVLREVFIPGYRGDATYSLAALNIGEWVYNFGLILGAALMVLAIGYFLRKIDQYFYSFDRISSRHGLLALTMVLLAIAGIPNLAWVGSFTYISRLSQQVVPIIVLGIPFAFRVRHKPRRPRLHAQETAPHISRITP